MSGRRTEQHQYYMDFAPLLLYLVAVILRQAKCHSLCTSETVAEVDKLLKNLPKMKLYDCKLYTPTLNDYRNCSKSMLECFVKETTVLSAETKERLKLLRMLKNLRRRLQDRKPPCPVCEFYKEEKAETFLKTLVTILQAMNTMGNCSG
ncbi:interleukin 15, like isoform X2 [Salminus brasiliensis]|uniref:interleukin 15, like isoform X2 n=1 Tax=Salminus brasiliensis TaxID=930266 RepID=UPI003B82E43F